jgi:hypothetical protein
MALSLWKGRNERTGCRLDQETGREYCSLNRQGYGRRRRRFWLFGNVNPPDRRDSHWGGAEDHCKLGDNQRKSPLDSSPLTDAYHKSFETL